MPAGETEQSPSGLTVDTLNILMTERFRAVYKAIDDMDRRLQERFDGQQKAIEDKAAETTTRFESVNEFRAQQADLIARFIPRAEAEQRIGENTSKLSDLSVRHNTDVATINSRLDLIAGSTAGIDKSRQLVSWMITAVVGLIAIATAAIALTR